MNETEIYNLCRAVKLDISDEYRAFVDDEVPGIQLTVATNEDMSEWNYQTGDNSYTGGAYFYPHWAVVGVYRTSNCRHLVKDILNQLEDLTSQ